MGTLSFPATFNMFCLTFTLQVHIALDELGITEQPSDAHACSLLTAQWPMPLTARHLS